MTFSIHFTCLYFSNSCILNQPSKEERKQEEESTQKMEEMKREGEKSREALLVITVISKSFSERFDPSSNLLLLPRIRRKTSPRREIEEQAARKEKKSKEGGRGWGKSWITVTYIHRMKEFWSQSLAVVAVVLFGANIVKIEEKIEGSWFLGKSIAY